TFTTVLSFANSAPRAWADSNMSLAKGFERCLADYKKGWGNYVKTLPKVDPKYQAQFNMAAMVLKAHEDKTRRGANIASLSIPWGGGANANENNVGGYHLVWARDLYQVATAYMAWGDKAAAERALDFLFNVQQKPDGSFPQNSWLDGKPFWGSLQMDEVAYPLILAYQLGKNDKATYEKHIKKAADFIVKNGPATPQERWEEEGGYSPSTIAAEIAGLVCAAEIARKNSDEASAKTYLATADNWQANIEKWTATTTGRYGDGNYYLRITKNGKPDAGDKIEINNGAGTFDERDIVDAGFLELVRLGIKPPNDPLIVKSLKIIDQVIKVDTPNGVGFYRYDHDGYGEMDDGRPWNWDGKYTGKGRLWPLLSGERGEYEIADCGSRIADLSVPSASAGGLKSSDECLRKAESRLDAMRRFANDGLMIPEQIWDMKEVPKQHLEFSPDLKFGEGTGSATPLAWSMAQFIRLATNLKAGKNLETPQVVYNRYVKNGGQESVASGQGPARSSMTQHQVICIPEMSNHRLERNATRFPVIKRCKDGTYYAAFAYRGKAKKVQIAGDFTGWKPSYSLVQEEQFAPTQQEYDTNKHLSLEFRPAARVEYKLIVDGKWILDPLNPNKVDNGVGGENSFFTMPDYKPTPWDKGETPKTDEFEIVSKDFGTRTIKVYVPKLVSPAGAIGLRQKRNIKTSSPKNVQPPATAGGIDALPVLYVEDGSDYVNRGKAIQIQQNLVKAGKVGPFIMVFLDPKDRMKEYWANDQWADFVANEVVPEVDKRYRTIKDRRERALLGASLGGVTSIWTALRHPDVFARVGGQSSSFWIDNERVVKALEDLDGKTKFKFYIDDGALEGVDNSRKVAKLLRDKGFDVTYNLAEAGHNWTAWRDRLADAFIALWK
ncbi:MAG TPA: glycoside hydrolase family 15 protein, partial [Pyrinomonadaceae bacterium]|nr:glycoside hydrolase family 15 protein [Pyrinomonadaceae bacterium]